MTGLKDFADRLGIYTEQFCPYCPFEEPNPGLMQVHVTVQHAIAPGDQSPIRCAMQRGARIVAEAIWRGCMPGGWTE